MAHRHKGTLTHYHCSIFFAHRNLHNKDLLPANTYVIGVARSALTSQSLYDKVTPYVTLRNETERAKYELFWQQRVSYFRTKSSTNASEYHRLNQKLQEIETQFESCNRLFYFALPPHIYADVAKAVHNTSMSQRFHSILFEFFF